MEEVDATPSLLIGTALKEIFKRESTNPYLAITIQRVDHQLQLIIVTKKENWQDRINNDVRILLEEVQQSVDKWALVSQEWVQKLLDTSTDENSFHNLNILLLEDKFLVRPILSDFRQGQHAMVGRASERRSLSMSDSLECLITNSRIKKLYPGTDLTNLVVNSPFENILLRYDKFVSKQSPLTGCVLSTMDYLEVCNSIQALLTSNNTITKILVLSHSGYNSRLIKSHLNQGIQDKVDCDCIDSYRSMAIDSLYDAIFIINPEDKLKTSVSKVTMDMIEKLSDYDGFKVLCTNSPCVSDFDNIWLYLRLAQPTFLSNEVGLSLAKSSPDKRDLLLQAMRSLVVPVGNESISNLRTVNFGLSDAEMNMYKPSLNTSMSNLKRGEYKRKFTAMNDVPGTSSKFQAIIAELNVILSQGNANVTIAVFEKDVMDSLLVELKQAFPQSTVLSNTKRARDEQSFLNSYNNLNGPKILLVPFKGMSMLKVPSSHLILFDSVLNVSMFEKLKTVCSGRIANGAVVPLEVIRLICTTDSFGGGSRWAQMDELMSFNKSILTQASGSASSSSSSSIPVNGLL
jgi:hypothetical protein